MRIVLTPFIKDAEGRYTKLPPSQITVRCDGSALVHLVQFGERPQRYAVIDAADVGLVASRRWRWVRSRNTFYARTVNPVIYMHRLIFGLTAGKVDHKDNDGLNNRRGNLRAATSRQNLQSKPKRRGASKYKGVSFHKGHNLWRSQIVVCGKNLTLGYFTNQADAAKTYDQAAIKHFGEFAQINFPG